MLENLKELTYHLFLLFMELKEKKHLVNLEEVNMLLKELKMVNQKEQMPE